MCLRMVAPSLVMTTSPWAVWIYAITTKRVRNEREATVGPQHLSPSSPVFRPGEDDEPSCPFPLDRARFGQHPRQTWQQSCSTVGPPSAFPANVPSRNQTRSRQHRPWFIRQKKGLTLSLNWPFPIVAGARAAMLGKMRGRERVVGRDPELSFEISTWDDVCYLPSP
jgi:hypothetical protein